ncbi:hypothetical protein ACQYRI_11995 [Salmonella enterica]
MNAKEEGIVTALKKISEAVNRTIQEATNAGMIEHAANAMIITKVTAEAAEIIEKQDKEIAELKKQAASRNNTSDIGCRIFIAGSAPQEHIIIAELAGKYLISPYPLTESGLLTNVRLINRDQAVFIDGAQHAVFNA